MPYLGIQPGLGLWIACTLVVGGAEHSATEPSRDKRHRRGRKDVEPTLKRVDYQDTNQVADRVGAQLKSRGELGGSVGLLRHRRWSLFSSARKSPNSPHGSLLFSGQVVGALFEICNLLVPSFLRVVQIVPRQEPWPIHSQNGQKHSCSVFRPAVAKHKTMPLLECDCCTGTRRLRLSAGETINFQNP